MKTEYRGLLAIGLAAAFFILWYTVINPPAKQGANTAQPPQVAAVENIKQTQPVQSQISETFDPQAKLPEKTWTIKNKLAEIEFTNDGAVPIHWKLFDYRQTTDSSSPAVDLVSNLNSLVKPLTLSFESANFAFPKMPKFEIAEATESRIVFVWRSQEVEVKKIVTLSDDNYLADVAVEVKNFTKRPLTGKPTIEWSVVNVPQESGGLLSFLKQSASDNAVLEYYLNGKVERETNIAKVGKKEEKIGAALWAGLGSRYFLGAIIPRVQGEGLSIALGVFDAPEGLAKGSHGLLVGSSLPSVTVASGGETKSLFSVYAGPKDVNYLKKVGVHLEDAIDYGWFTVVAVPIAYLLRFFYGIVHNYGLAIIILTIFVKLLLHPINVKSLKSMKAMQQLQPRLKELQVKYKGDKARINQETMNLFRAHKVNPMGGCLPMLLQFPIYIALYKVLWSSIELYHAPFFWFYKDLSAPDPYFITPVLLGIFMVAQQRLMPSTSSDPAQQKMMMMMPIMFSVFMLFLPVGLVVYILVNTVMSVTQQYMHNNDITVRSLIKRK